MNWIKLIFHQLFLGLMFVAVLTAAVAGMLAFMIGCSVYLKELAVNGDQMFYLYVVLALFWLCRHGFAWILHKLEMFFEKRGLE